MGRHRQALWLLLVILCDVCVRCRAAVHLRADVGDAGPATR